MRRSSCDSGGLELRTSTEEGCKFTWQASLKAGAIDSDSLKPRRPSSPTRISVALQSSIELSVCHATHCETPKGGK